MTIKQAMKRIEELERRVKELENRPPQQFHYHYNQPQHQQPYSPLYPYSPWCGNVGAGVSASQ